MPRAEDSNRPEPNAIKFERFIFDLLPEARHAIVVEVDEAQTFAPVKNAPGEKRDTPESVQAQMIAVARRVGCARPAARWRRAWRSKSAPCLPRMPRKWLLASDREWS